MQTDLDRTAGREIGKGESGTRRARAGRAPPSRVRVPGRPLETRKAVRLISGLL